MEECDYLLRVFSSQKYAVLLLPDITLFSKDKVQLRVIGSAPMGFN